MGKRPAYLEIAEQIRREWLEQPGLRRGQRLPSQHELQQRFGASLPTIARALSVLTSEGLIRTRQGSGSFITSGSDAPATATGLISFIAQLTDDWLGVRSYRGAERRARAYGYQLLTASATFSAENEAELIEHHLRAGAVGVVISPVARTSEQLENDFLKERWRDVPIVAIDLGLELWERPIVVFDNFRVGYDMTRALLDHGHRNIAFMHVTDSQFWRSVNERREGWETAMLEAGIEIPESYRGWPNEPHLEEWLKGIHKDFDGLVRSLLGLDPVPDAVISWEDHTAMHLIRALLKAGVDVPGEIRVAGFDDHDASSFFQPPFPTSRPDFGRAGEVAVDIIHRMLTGSYTHPRTYILPVPILWRDPQTPPEEVEQESVIASPAQPLNP